MRDTGKEGGKERCRKEGMQDEWDSALQGVGCRIGGMQNKREARKEGCSKGGIQDWKDSGPERYMKGESQD